jgi:hypothetical protein
LRPKTLGQKIARCAIFACSRLGGLAPPAAYGGGSRARFSLRAACAQQADYGFRVAGGQEVFAEGFVV